MAYFCEGKSGTFFFWQNESDVTQVKAKKQRKTFVLSWRGDR